MDFVRTFGPTEVTSHRHLLKHPKWPRTEQRAVTMLLACLPEGVRRDLIASRRLSTVEIIYKLLITYQPGGPQERTVLPEGHH